MQHPRSHYNASCNIRFQTRISRRTWQHKTTTIMQPLQWVLQAKIPKHNVTAMCKNKQNTWKQPLQCGLLPALADPSPHPPRTRVTFHRPPEPLYPKKTRFPAPAFSQNEAHATSTQPLQCVLQHQVRNPHLSTHMATQNDNNHAAITMRFAGKDSKTQCNCNVQE